MAAAPGCRRFRSRHNRRTLLFLSKSRARPQRGQPGSPSACATSLGHQGCEANRLRKAKIAVARKLAVVLAPDVDRQHRIQMVKAGRQSTCVRPCRDAGVGAIAPGFAMLATLIRQRHLTRSCGGPVPTAERTLVLARMVMESWTTGTELENTECAPSTAASPGSFLCGSALANARVPPRSTAPHTSLPKCPFPPCPPPSPNRDRSKSSIETCSTRF